MSKSRRHILLVEEHRDVRTAFVALFERIYDYALHVAEDTRDALGTTGRQNVDIAVVDLGYGVELNSRLAMIRTWRRDGFVFPVIATSLHDQDSLLVEAFEAGADDFIRKPYLFSELHARINRQIARRLNSSPRIARINGVVLPEAPFSFAGAVITPDLRITFPNGRESTLTGKQVGILHELSRHAGALLLKEKLIFAVWGVDANTNSGSVHQYLHVLRKLYREGGIDLNDFIAPESKIGWRVSTESVEPLACG
jgi:DNA-binding response OmpR family regulator